MYYMIVKTKNEEYKVISHQTGRNFGVYATRSAAEKRLRQIKRFKK